MLVASALNQRALVAYLDFAAHRGIRRRHSRSGSRRARRRTSGAKGSRIGSRRTSTDDFDAPEDNVARALAFLGTVQSAVPIGSFVFVVSDFIAPPPHELWAQRGRPRLGRRPRDRPGPDLGAELSADRRRARRRSVTRTATIARHVRLSRQRGRGTSQAQRDAPRRRCCATSCRLGLDPILVGEAEPERVHAALLEWANVRLVSRPGSALTARRTRGELAAVAVAVACGARAPVLTIFAHGWWSGERRLVCASPRDRQRERHAGAVALRRGADGARADRRRPARRRCEAVALATNFKPYSVRDESRHISRRSRPCRRRRVRLRAAVHRPRMPAARRRAHRGGRGRAVRRAATVTLPQTCRRQRATRRSSGRPSAVQSRLTGDEIGLSTPKAIATAGARGSHVAHLSPAASPASPSVAALLLALGGGMARRDRRSPRPAARPDAAHPVASDAGRPRARARASTRPRTARWTRAARRSSGSRSSSAAAGGAAQAKAAERLAWSARGPSRTTVDELADGR